MLLTTTLLAYFVPSLLTSSISALYIIGDISWFAVHPFIIHFNIVSPFSFCVISGSPIEELPFLYVNPLGKVSSIIIFAFVKVSALSVLVCVNCGCILKQASYSPLRKLYVSLFSPVLMSIDVFFTLTFALITFTHVPKLHTPILLFVGSPILVKCCLFISLIL